MAGRCATAMRANEVRVFQIVNWRQNPHYTHRPQQQKRTEPTFNLWFENGAAWYPSRLFADSSKIPHFVRDSPVRTQTPQNRLNLPKKFAASTLENSWSEYTT